MEPTIQDLNAKINSQLLALESKIKAPDPEKSFDLRSSSISIVVNSLRNTKNNFMNLSLCSPTQSRISSLVRPRQQIIPITHHHSIQNHVFMVPRPSIVSVVPPRFLTDASEMESSLRMRTPVMIKTFYGKPDCFQNVPILQILKRKKEQLTQQFSILKMPTQTTDVRTSNNDLSSPTYTQVKNESKKDPFPPATAQIKQLIKRQLMETPFKLQSKKQTKSEIIDELEVQETDPEVKNYQIEQQKRKVSDSEQDIVSVPTKSTVVSPSNTAKQQISFPKHRRSSVQVQQKTVKKKKKEKKEIQQIKELKESKCETKEQSVIVSLQERFKQRLSEANITKQQSLSQTKVVYADLTLKRRGTTFMKRG